MLEGRVAIQTYHGVDEEGIEHVIIGIRLRIEIPCCHDALINYFEVSPRLISEIFQMLNKLKYSLALKLKQGCPHCGKKYSVDDVVYSSDLSYLPVYEAALKED